MGNEEPTLNSYPIPIINPNSIPVIGRHPYDHAADHYPSQIRYYLGKGKFQKEKKLSNERMNGKMKAINRVSLIEAHFVKVGRIGLIVTVRDPNPSKRRELKSTPNSPLFFLFKSTTYSPTLIWSGWRKHFKDSMVLRRGQAYFKFTRPNLLFSRHYQSLGNTY